MEQTSHVFNAQNITKYWKDFIPSVSGPFTDELFPPNNNSLLALDQNYNFIDKVEGQIKAQEINSAEIEWKRAGEIFSKYLLFDDKIECSDIKQGSLGNCYFLSAIAALTEFPQLIYQIFRIKEVSSQGYYEVVFFIDGEWTVVPVDDYFPVFKGRKEFPFTKPNGNELWVLILEKAWAKVNGGYANTISGWPSDPFSALTGFASERIDHKDMDLEVLWKLLMLAEKNDNIMCSSSKDNEDIEKHGLVKNHAYSLIGAKEKPHNGSNLRLIKLRNPWGYREWKEDWSDDSSLWTDELKSYFGHTHSDDGSFFISFEDFLKLFECTHVCYIMYDSYIKSIPITGDQLANAQIYNLYIPNEATVSISAIKKHWRFNRSLRNVNHPVSIVVGRWDSYKNSFTNFDGVYSAHNYAEFVLTKIPAGIYVIWLYCPLEQCESPQPDRITLRILSNCMYNLQFRSNDKDLDCIKELMKSACRELYENEIPSDNIYIAHSNSFKRTGICYRYVHNPSSTTYYRFEHQDKGKINCTVLGYEGQEKFETFVPPKRDGIVLGMRTHQYGSYWFNIGCTYWTMSCNEGQDPSNTRPVDLTAFVKEILRYEEIPENFYDYLSSSHDQASIELKFQHLDIKQVQIDDLTNEYPELMQQILDLADLNKNEDLTWIKQTYDNGMYIGQTDKSKQRHGRGAYYWTDSQYYIGYWQNSTKQTYARYLNANMSLFYEGEVKDGMKHGKGTYYFNNGYYTGQFVNDIREGPGTYYWNDGTRWEGQCVNGQLKGVGTQYYSDGSSAQAEFS